MISGNFLTLVEGTASAPMARLTAPLSLWGGLDLNTGCICDVSHPEFGISIAGRILVMPGARGSSSSSSALVEAARRGIAPSAIILSRTDPILVIGGLVAFNLYGTHLPILLADELAWQGLPHDRAISIDAPDNGTARVAVL